MNKRVMMFLTIIILVILLLDAYTFKSVLYFSKELNQTAKIILYTVFWLIPFSILVIAITLSYKANTLPYNEMDYRSFFALFGAVVLFYVPKIVFNSFQLMEDLISGFNYLIDTFMFHNHFQRYTFLSKIGFYFSVVLFIYIGHGIVFGKYNYKTSFTRIAYPNLPAGFHGYKIVHLSDTHIGSLRNKEKVKEAIESINALEPDIILFTGDLINNFAREMDGWEDIFARLKAKDGKFSVLGNHDYGDYIEWPSEKEKQQNIKDVIHKHELTGFQLLLNRSVPISKGNDTIYISGVENWGLPPFHQYGDLQQAISEIPANKFKILLSHDPSHWDAEIVPKTNIDLTLSGHTHGMQAGISLPFFKWSPVKYKYPRWSGLYSEGKQHLYVNQGFGFIGFPGRIGMPPEITVIELVHIKE